MGNIVLGIHSNVAGDDADFTGGHAWVTITQKGKTTFYGLWPDAHPRTVDNGDGSDIRVGLEASATAKASRYYKLSDAQAKRFNALVKANVHWFYTNNCSSWASELVDEVIGVDVDADDWFGIETPRELGRNILLLEKKDPTTIYAPKLVKKGPASSVLSSSSSH
jgi:hypothetical protein